MMSRTKLFNICIVFCMVLNMVPLAQSSSNSSLESRILYVGGSGPGNYSSIKNAIKDASDGDTIFVYHGIYPGHIRIYKSISLIGENMYTTVINNGGEAGDIIEITADNVHVSGFTLRNGGQGHDYPNDAALKINQSNNNLIENLYCLQINYGIWALYSENNTIRNNTLHCLYDNIWLFATKKCQVYNNNMNEASLVLDGKCLEDFQHNVSNNIVNGKPVYYYRDTSGLTVPQDAGQVILVNCTGFVIENLNLHHVTDGIELFFSGCNTIKNNYIHDNIDFGIRLAYSRGNAIIQNEIVDNPIAIGFMSGGIWIENFGGHCYHDLIRENTIKDSWYQGLRFDHAYYTTVSKNNFINNGHKSENSGSHVYFLNSFECQYFDNYWDDWIGLKHPKLSFLPKLLRGQRNMFWLFPLRTMPWFALDRSPQNATISL